MGDGVPQNTNGPFQLTRRRVIGFIAPERGGAELFVHISAFARDGSKPVVGEKVSFALGRGPDGRPQAVKVVRDWVGTNGSARRSGASPATRPGSSLQGTLQMTSCAEAIWFVNNCPDTQMDGNRDGVPCEQQWCPVPGAR